ncbi:MAG: HTH domain-containing protein [Saezia sp.]
MEINVRDIVKQRLQEKGITLGILSKATNIEENQIRNYFGGQMDLFDQHREELNYFLSMLIEGMEITEDERIGTLIQFLIEKRYLTKKIIASYATVSEKEVNDMIICPENLPNKVKYKLAVTVMMLHFIFSGAGLNNIKAEDRGD